MTALLLLASYAVGVAVAENASPFPAWAVAVPLLLSLTFILCRQRRQIATLLLCAISLCLGIALDNLHRHPLVTDDHLLSYSEREPVVIDGEILRISERALSGYAIDLRAGRVVEEGAARPVHGRLRLYVEEGENHWIPGDIIRFSSRLREPRLFGTPGEFDPGRQLALEGIYVTAYAAKSEEILLLQSSTDNDLWLAKQHTATARFIAQSTSATYAPLVKALAIGDRSGLSPELRDLLARSGLSHLFAISGLHLALIALALYALGLVLYRQSTRLLLFSPPARFLPLLIAPLLVLYLLWTGCGVSTQRAVIMVLSGTLLFLLRRKCDLLHLLCVAALLLLLWQPLLLFAPSFQLSFAALAGIILGGRRWQPYLSGRPPAVRYPSALFLSSLCATLATTPLVLYHFHLLAPAGMINNLFAIPIIGWLGVPLALGGSLLWPIAPQLATLLLTGCEAVLKWSLHLASMTTSLPGLSGFTLYPSLPLIAIATLLLIALFLPPAQRVLRISLLCVSCLLFLWPEPPQQALTVTSFSVGQGDSTLISFGDKHLLIDGGGLYSQRIDTGRQLVAPALGRLGIRRLSRVILTHFHPDHAKGLTSIISDIPCEGLVIPAPLPADDPLTQVTVKKGIPTEQTSSGWHKLLSSEGREAYIYQSPLNESDDENDRSLVIYVRDGDQGVLLTGDLGSDGVQSLIHNPPPGPVTLMKLPHHGSVHSRPAPLLEYLRPRQTFVSVGYQNRFNFPHPEVIRSLSALKIPLWRTDRDGSIQFRLRSGQWQAERLSSGFFVDTAVTALLDMCGFST